MLVDDWKGQYCFVGTQNVISQSGPKDRPRADATAILAMHNQPAGPDPCDLGQAVTGYRHAARPSEFEVLSRHRGKKALQFSTRPCRVCTRAGPVEPPDTTNNQSVIVIHSK